MTTTPNTSLLRWQFLFRGLLIAVTLAALVLAYPLLKQGWVLETDLQSLFPKDSRNPLVDKINERLYREFGNKILLGVQAPKAEMANAAAASLAAAIAANPQLKSGALKAQMSLAAQQYGLLQQYRYQLLTPAQQQLIRQQPQVLLAQAQAALFGFNLGNSLSPLQDPLNLVPAYLQQLQPPFKGELIGERMVIANSDGQLILFALELQGESFSLELQAQMHLWVQQLRAQLAADPATQAAHLLVSGAVFHAAEASVNAQREMAIIGGGSSLGVLLLFLLAFRRVRPLLLTLVSVAYGCGLALVVNHFLFGRIHVMTLVFGASLIGVAVDYSLHYLCKYQDLSLRPETAIGRGQRVLGVLLPALSLSLLASVLGYSSLLPTPLPGLQQIALFSVMGLCGAWLFLVVIYPLLVRQPLPLPAPLIQRCAAATGQFWQRTRGWPQQIIFAGLALLMALGLLLASRSSDVRTLYKPSAELMASEQRLHGALQGVSPNQYFLLRAASAEELLQAEEQLRFTQLDGLVAAGALAGYQATSSLVPSQRQQQANYELMRTQLYSADGLAGQFMQAAGFDAGAIAQAQAEFAAAAQQYLPVEAWLAVARPDQSLLWLGQVEGSYTSIIALRGVVDIEALAAAADKPAVIWVDRVAAMSQLLQHLMDSAALLLLLAYLAILPLLWLYFRRKRALLLILVPLMASATTLSLLSVCGIPINLFHLFGCYLILGLGMDYGIFSYTQGAQDPVTQRAIWLSAMSSSLSFGLLALSATPMVSAFGITLFLGCCFNLLYAPLAGQLRPLLQAQGVGHGC